MKVAILGSGSWGTALGNVLCNNGVETLIWGVSEDEINDINKNRQNTRYFDTELNSNLKGTTNISDIKDADVVLLAVPTGAVEEVSIKASSVLEKPVIVINVAKGFHPITHERLSVVIKNNFSKLKAVVSLIGPSHAEEVVLGLLTSLNAVSDDEESAKLIQNLFSNSYFRVYTNTDVVGAEIGVALKNIMAIASGILTGIGQGDNAKAALMTRGLAEMARYGIYFGGRPETFLGLAGVGDLIVTCTSVHSRNFQAGLIIGKNNSAKEFLETNKSTVEGIKACKVVYEEANKYNISMPITEQVYKVLYEGKLPTDAANELMNRDLKPEY